MPWTKTKVKMHKDGPPNYGGKHHEQMIQTHMRKLKKDFPTAYMRLAPYATHPAGCCVGCDAIRRLARI